MLSRSTQRHVTAFSGSRHCQCRPVDSWIYSLLLIIPTCLCIFFFKKILFLSLILTIFKQFKQPFSLRKTHLKILSVISVPKAKIKFMEKLTVEKWPQIFEKMICLGLRIHQRLWTISCLWYFLGIFF